MRAKKEIPSICESVLGVLPERAQWAWSAISDLEKSHKSSLVISDFREWASENVGDDFPRGILKSYLDVASGRLSSHSSTPSASSKSPEVVSLVRELVYLSGGQIIFVDKQKAKLGEVLSEFTSEEITVVFKEWLSNQDLNDPKNLSFLPGKFVQAADSLAYTLRRTREENEKEQKARDAKVIQMQQQAELARQEAEKKRAEEDDAFDPLANLLG